MISYEFTEHNKLASIHFPLHVIAPSALLLFTVGTLPTSSIF